MEEFKLKRHLKFTEKNYHNIVFFTGSGYMPITGANPYHTYINSNETLSFRVSVGCMRRFALMNFQIYTKVDSKLSYTPCYV
jgi:hypothetical protein